jgi:hypothetical protein
MPSRSFCALMRPHGSEALSYPPLSGGDRKALAKELTKSRAMTGILAARAGEAPWQGSSCSLRNSLVDVFQTSSRMSKQAKIENVRPMLNIILIQIYRRSCRSVLTAARRAAVKRVDRKIRQIGTAGSLIAAASGKLDPSAPNDHRPLNTDAISLHTSWLGSPAG